MCPRGCAILDMATSEEVAIAIFGAYNLFNQTRRSRGGEMYFNEKLELAQVRYKHALRRLKVAYPGEFCDFSEQSPWDMIGWTIALQSVGMTVPAAVDAAKQIGFKLQQAAADHAAARAH